MKSMKSIFALLATALTCLAQDNLWLKNWPEPDKHHERTITVSNTVYTIKYDLTSTWAHVPLTYPPGQPHYDCEATIFVGTNKIGQIDTQWTEHGCVEDNPMSLVGQALTWERYPNESAGAGHHWVVKGGAMLRGSA